MYEVRSIEPSSKIGLATPPYIESNPFLLRIIFIANVANCVVYAKNYGAVFFSIMQHF